MSAAIRAMLAEWAARDAPTKQVAPSQYGAKIKEAAELLDRGFVAAEGLGASLRRH